MARQPVARNKLSVACNVSPRRIKDLMPYTSFAPIPNQHYINSLSLWHGPCYLYKVTHENNALTTSVLNE
jgi:hypothetical protein